MLGIYAFFTMFNWICGGRPLGSSHSAAESAKVLSQPVSPKFAQFVAFADDIVCPLPASGACMVGVFSTSAAVGAGSLELQPAAAASAMTSIIRTRMLWLSVGAEIARIRTLTRNPNSGEFGYGPKAPSQS
jgi:hypothetical protein